MPDTLHGIPEITDEDVEWVSDLLKLKDLDEPRRAFLVARTTLDVSACPGSGKTTLVVAKLAMLARKWTWATRGICVLSHTNVAREQIQHRLGGTVVGQRLLGYPHFIDTIHGFVNRFLALPWLRSKGYPPPTVGDDVTVAHRRRALTNEDFWTLQNFLERKYSGFEQLRICDRKLSFGIKGKAFPASPTSRSFQIAKAAVTAGAHDGYFCYDEMFVWAHALLEDVPAVASWLRQRFPLVIIDEMQDTGEKPGVTLQRIFPRSSAEAVVQRIGDPNQAIFDDADAGRGVSDPYPDPADGRRLSIPNSLRFGADVATLASPFAVTPVGSEGLCGMGPRAIAGTVASRAHAIFIFPDDSTAGLLDAFGMHVLRSCDDVALRHGRVVAVGAVHQVATDVAPGHAHFPKSVPHYWVGYSAEIMHREPHQKSLAQYFRTAQAAAKRSGDFAPGVERIASGLIRLGDRIGDVGRLRQRMRMHRAVVHALEGDRNALTIYRRLLKAILADRLPMSEAEWGKLRAESLLVASALCAGPIDASGGAEFVDWPTGEASLSICAPDAPRDVAPNVYRVMDGSRCLDIHLGSIHSIKGETHLATLLLDTYWHAHSSKRMLPWLLGTKVNAGNAGVQDRERLLQTYVAMTRPSHLICLAMRRSTLGAEPEMSEKLATLRARGWSLAELVDGVPRWNT